MIRWILEVMEALLLPTQPRKEFRDRMLKGLPRPTREVGYRRLPLHASGRRYRNINEFTRPH